MKIYVWDGETETLRRYTDGAAMAAADTKEEAIEKIIQNFHEEHETTFYTNDYTESNQLARELKETECKEVEIENFVYWHFGSE